MDADLDQVLSPEALTGHGEWDVEALRDVRNRCKRVEVALSYLRRLAQGRIDIIGAELARREAGGDPLALDGLLELLPEALSVGTRSANVGPISQFSAPEDFEGVLVEELAEMEVEARLSELPEVSTDWLVSTQERLAAYERRISGLRTQIFERIDVLGVELGRRYRAGDADIDAAINNS